MVGRGRGIPEAAFGMNIMVRIAYCMPTISIQSPRACPRHIFISEADPSVPCTARLRCRKVLEAKYRFFWEAIDIQKRWRTQMEEASQNEE